jgi:hypothetical protein
MLPRLDASVLQYPIQEPGADVLLRVDSDGDNPFGRWAPELPMASFAGPELLESMGLHQPDELGPRHSRTSSNQTFGFVKPVCAATISVQKIGRDDQAGCTKGAPMRRRDGLTHTRTTRRNSRRPDTPRRP